MNLRQRFDFWCGRIDEFGFLPAQYAFVARGEHEKATKETREHSELQSGTSQHHHVRGANASPPSDRERKIKWCIPRKKQLSRKSEDSKTGQRQYSVRKRVRTTGRADKPRPFAGAPRLREQGCGPDGLRASGSTGIRAAPFAARGYRATAFRFVLSSAWRRLRRWFAGREECSFC
jgi:hypothetical protein